MNNLMNVSWVWQEEEPSEEKLRLENIRRVSNVIQALENVAAQCEGNDDFNKIDGPIQEFLRLSRRKLHQLIHQPL